MIKSFFYGNFLIWLPFVASAVFLFIVICAARTKQDKDFEVFSSRLVWSAIVWRLVFSALLTALQYLLWQGNSFTKILLHLPLDGSVPLFGVLQVFGFLHRVSWGYFVYYSFYHFWLVTVVSLVVAFVWYWVCRFWQWKRPEGFVSSDISLFTLGCLLILWPQDLLFIFTALFLGVVWLGVAPFMLRGERRITLTLPIILSIGLVLFFGKAIIIALGLKWLIL